MQNQQEFLQLLEKDIEALLESPPSYMREISKFSLKIVSMEIKYLFYVINKISQIIKDQYQPIKRKFLAFRFVKDTFLYASHSFYLLVTIIIFPLIAEVLKEGSDKTDNGLQYLIRKIGPKPQISNSIEVKTISQTLLQLLNQFMKWTGTNIKLHPYYKIPYSSIYKSYLQRLNKTKSIKITDLTYYTSNDFKNYQQNYLQNQLQSDEWIKKQEQFVELLISSWISLPDDEEDKMKSLNILQNMVQTGDSLIMSNIIHVIKPLIESEITGYQAIQVVAQIMKLKQLEFYVLVRDQLLVSIQFYVIMMSKEKFSKIQQIDLLLILGQIFVWKLYSSKLGLKIQSYDQFFKKMKQQWVCTSDSQYTSKAGKLEEQFQKHKYLFNYSQVQLTNKQKKNHLNLRQDEKLIKKIKNLEYRLRDQNKFRDQAFNQSLKIQNNSTRKENILQKEKIQLPREQQLQKQMRQDQNNFKNMKESMNNNNFEFDVLQSQSPIKKLNLVSEKQLGINQRNIENIKNQEFIKFNNSINNISSSNSHVNFEIEEKNKNNIYTRKQQKAVKNNSVLSKSSRSNRSSKKSGEKLEKISSLGFGVQRVKSSKLINYQIQEQKRKQQEDRIKILKNKKPNIMKFDEESQNVKPNKISQSKLYKSIQSDNNPYRDDSSANVGHRNQKITAINSQALSRSRKLLKNQQIIVVQQTVKKPKFSFQSQEESSIEQKYSQKNKILKNKNIYTDLFPIINTSLETIKIDPFLLNEDKLSQCSDIPSNFNQALKLKKQVKNNLSDMQSDSQQQLGIRINKYPNKLKQLQLQIQRTKQHQLLYQQKMIEKDHEYQNLVKNLPPNHQYIYQDNQRLKIKLQQKQRIQTEKITRKQQKLITSPRNFVKSTQSIPFLPNKIFDLPNIKPYQNNFVKQVISNKCLLEKNQLFQLGYAFKKNQLNLISAHSYSICFYFKFKLKCEKCSFQVVSQSLIFNEPFEATMVNIVANKQMKFQQKIIGYQLFDENFKIPQIKIQINPDKYVLELLSQNNSKEEKIKRNYKIQIPCALYNFIQFHSPMKKIQKIKTKYAISSKFAIHQFVDSLKGQYLTNTFKCGKWIQSSQKEKENTYYLSFFIYVKRNQTKKTKNNQQNTIIFEQLKDQQKVQVNLLIKKINGLMFYIESDNQFQQDKIILSEVTRMIAK